MAAAAAAAAAEPPLPAGQYKVIRNPWIQATNRDTGDTIYIRAGGIIEVTEDGQTTTTIQGKTTDALATDAEGTAIPAGTAILFSRGSEAVPAIKRMQRRSQRKSRAPVKLTYRQGNRRKSAQRNSRRLRK